MATATSLDRAALDDLLARARLEVQEGRLPACQVAVGFKGELVAFEAYGDCTTDHRFVIFSCTKAITSAGAWALMGDGLLDPADSVASLLPGFGANGKEAITVEQVLTHTSGFPYAPLPFREWTDHQARLARYQTWYPTSEPGSRYEYHPGNAQWVVADVLAELTGQDFRQVLRERVLDPLGLDGLRVGLVAEDEIGPLARLGHVGEFMEATEAQQAEGITTEALAEVGLLGEQVLLRLDSPAAIDAGLPGGGGIGTAADLALLYQGFLHNPGLVWDPATLENATQHVRSALPDPSWPFPSNRSLGIVVRESGAGINPTVGGRESSGRAFGHDGAAGQLAWADPASGLSLGFLTNALERNTLQVHRRSAALSNRAAHIAPG